MKLNLPIKQVGKNYHIPAWTWMMVQLDHEIAAGFLSKRSICQCLFLLWLWRGVKLIMRMDRSSLHQGTFERLNKQLDKKLHSTHDKCQWGFHPWQASKRPIARIKSG
jgi:hypothetical protein